MTHDHRIDRTPYTRDRLAWFGLAATLAAAALPACMEEGAGLPGEMADEAEDAVPADTTELPTTEYSQAVGSFPVGVIPGAGESCPADSGEVIIAMDDEDTTNTSSRSGWIGKTNLNETSKNTRFYFCRVDGNKFKPFSKINKLDNEHDDYAVLKLGDACPPGSVQLKRHFDNEDTNNGNFSDGSIAPNVSTQNTDLYFCIFRAAQLDDDTISEFPSLGAGFSYGVFGPPDFLHSTTEPANAHPLGTIRTDDEDNDNDNDYEIAANASNAAQRIIDPDNSATVLHVVRAR